MFSKCLGQWSQKKPPQSNDEVHCFHNYATSLIVRCSEGFTLKSGTWKPFQQQYKEAEVSVLSEVPQPNRGIMLVLFGFFPLNYYRVDFNCPVDHLPNACVFTFFLSQGFSILGVLPFFLLQNCVFGLTATLKRSETSF